MISGAKAIPGIIDDVRKKYDPERLADALALIIKLFENLENNPVEVKFRSVKKTNPTLMAKLFCFSGIQRLFEVLGFNEDAEFYRFTQQDITPIRHALILLRAEEVSLRTHQNEDEETKKRNAMINAELKRKDEEKRKLIESMKQDRQEKREDLKNHPVKSSKAKELKFGSKLITQQELNPNCNDTGGGG